MEINYAEIMSEKSDEGLRDYIGNYQKYTPELVNSAIAESQKRGQAFTNEQLTEIENHFQKVTAAYQKDSGGFWNSNSKWKQSIVTDETAPLYYSQRAIQTFSILFGAITGAILLAINLRETPEKKSFFEVLGFGIGYSSLEVWILSFFPSVSGPGLALNVIGAAIINNFFWKKYIGKDTKYRAKPIWIPLAICILITVIMIYFMILERNQ